MEEIAETLRENVAREIVDALNGEIAASVSEEDIRGAARAISRRVEAVILDPALQADLCRRIGYRPASFQLVSERRLREAARELLDAAAEARDLLARRGSSKDRTVVVRLERALRKALRGPA